MARKARFTPIGSIVHVVNRGVERRRLFYEPRDYQRFIELLALGKEQHRVRVLGVCVMPNHYHALLCPDQDRAISAYLHWVQGCYACEFRARTQSKGHGHVFQQRFWSGIIFDEHHLPGGAALHRGQSGRGSTRDACGGVAMEQPGPAAARSEPVLDPLPLELPSNWTEIVNQEPLPDDAD